MSERTAAEIRHDIDLQRQDLGRSVEALRGRVTELTDWRRKVHEHRSQLIVGAAVAADLGDEGWLAAEDFATVVDQAGGGLVVLDVLDDPGVEVGVVALAGIVAQALDRAGPGADTLHRGDLLLQGEDRLDLQRRANEGAGAADPAAAPPSAQRPIPPAAERESKTLIRSPPLPSSMRRWRAWPAASQVPEIPAEIWIEAISRPASSSGS